MFPIQRSGDMITAGRLPFSVRDARRVTGENVLEAGLPVSACPRQLPVARASAHNQLLRRKGPHQTQAQPAGSAAQHRQLRTGDDTADLRSKEKAGSKEPQNPVP